MCVDGIQQRHVGDADRHRGGTGTGQVRYSVGPNSGLARSTQLTVAGTTVTLNQSGDVDSDGDGMPDSYEIAFGLNPNSATGGDGAGGDPDGDGQTNLQEFQAQPSTHPRGFQRRYLAEGAVNAFFSTEIDILNADRSRPRRRWCASSRKGRPSVRYVISVAEPDARDAVDADARRADDGTVLDVDRSRRRSSSIAP